LEQGIEIRNKGETASLQCEETFFSEAIRKHFVSVHQELEELGSIGIDK
jgi:hypothetical protein